jgi:hypothetical protein
MNDAKLQRVNQGDGYILDCCLEPSLHYSTVGASITSWQIVGKLSFQAKNV